MAQFLRVVMAFGPFTAGQTISDPGQIAVILAAGYGPNVVDASAGPTRPGLTIVVFGPPAAVLGATYDYALDLTSTPNTLYQWSGSAWSIVLQVGTGGTTAPTLAALTLSKLTGTVGVAFSANLSGATAGSTLAATAADGTVLTLANGALSGTFTLAGQKQILIVETLAGAAGSPKTTTLTLTIAAATPVLQALGLASLAAVVGTPFSAALSGQTAESTVVATSSDGTVLTVANGQVSGTFTAAGAPTITLTETLAGATGSPKSTQLATTVSATAPTGGALDFSDAANSGLAGL